MLYSKKEVNGYWVIPAYYQPFVKVPVGKDVDGIIENLKAEELERFKSESIASLNLHMEDEWNKYLNKYSPPERETFNERQKEAKEWKLDNTAATPNIDDMTLHLGEAARLEMIEAVDKKRKNILKVTMSGVVIRDTIKKALTIEDIEKISWDHITYMEV